MRKILTNKPLYIIRRLLLIIATLVFISCATSENKTVTQEKQVKEGVIIFTNKTPFTVHLVRGSGRVDVGTVAPLSSLNVINSFNSAESYYPLFDIPLLDSWSLEKVRPDDREYYFHIDNSLARQVIEITMPRSFVDTSAYIIFANKGRSGGVSVSLNDSNDRMTGINFSEVKSNINVGETVVYRVNPQNLRNFKINPLNKTFGNQTYKSGFIYTFVFDGNDVLQIDVRSLTEVKADSPIKIEFTGSALTTAEQQEIITILDETFKNNNVPLRIIDLGDAFYTMRVNSRIQVQPPQPPVNREIITAEFSLLLFRSGRELLKPEEFKDIKDMNRNIVIRNAVNQIKNASGFFKNINQVMIL